MRKRFAVIPDPVPGSVGTRVGKIDPGIIAGATMLESVILSGACKGEVEWIQRRLGWRLVVGK